MNPSQEALKLADELLTEIEEGNSQHFTREFFAEVIDRELALPQRNAALLLAQGIADSFDQWPTTRTQIHELRDALAAIHK